MFGRRLLDTSPSRRRALSRAFSKYLEGTRQRPCTFAVWTARAPQSRDMEATCQLAELAAQLKVSVQTIYDLRSKGRGPRGFRVGTQLRFRESEIEPGSRAWRWPMNSASRRRVMNGGRPRTLIGSYGTMSVSRRGASYVALARIRERTGACAE